ncbi:MAG: tetratricopeptide repeat protein, partial [Meiothermus sp.]|nr:tetratricopeptide repeat protein [Meiothermus sp.]
GVALAQQPAPPAQPAQPAPAGQTQANLCILLSQSNRYDAALTACERAVKESPSAENLYLLGTVQSELGRYTPAIENLRRSIGLNSSLVQAYIALARVYMRQYQFADNRATAAPVLEQALSVLREAERVNPRYAPTLATRAVVLGYLGRTEQAIDAFNRSLAIKDEPLVRASLADLYAGQSRWDDAVRNYDLAVKAAPNNASLRVKYGSLLMVRGEIDKAITHLDQAVVLSPGNAEAWLRRGDAYYEKKDWTQAGVSYNQTVALSPVRFPDAYVGLGLVFIELKDFPKAKFNFTKAVALDNNNANYRFALCRANMLVGDKAGAKTQCERAVSLRPDFPQAKEVLDQLR